MYINGEKQLVCLVTSDSKQTQNDDSDSSIKETKMPKTLKPFYTVSDSDENEEKRKNLQQVDGNGSDCVVMSTTAGSNILFGSSIEECGDKISLAPALSMPSCVTISDTSAKHSNGNSNANADDSHANSNALRLTCLLKRYDSEKTVFCDLCPEIFFTLDGLLRHNKSVHDSEESDTSQSEYPLAECLILSSDGCVQSSEIETDKDVAEIDMTEPEPTEDNETEKEDSGDNK